MYRIAQCAVDNAVRHSGATRIAIRLAAAATCSVEIADTGRGFDPETTAGYGLTLIRRLTARYRLRLSLRSGAGHGTIIQVSTTLGETSDGV
jgi:signal transduction histidine kinase